MEQFAYTQMFSLLIENFLAAQKSMHTVNKSQHFSRQSDYLLGLFDNYVGSERCHSRVQSHQSSHKHHLDDMVKNEEISPRRLNHDYY